MRALDWAGAGVASTSGREHQCVRPKTMGRRAEEQPGHGSCVARRGPQRLTSRGIGFFGAEVRGAAGAGNDRVEVEEHSCIREFLYVRSFVSI